MPSKDALYTEFSAREPVSHINTQVGKFGHLIGRRLGTPSLRESPVKLATFESSRTIFYSLSWPEFKVEGRSTLNLLSGAKSPEAQGTQDPLDVLDDYQTMDYVEGEDLIKMHVEDLEPHFTRFNKLHRLRFIDSLMNLPAGEMREIMNRKVARHVPRDYALSHQDELFTPPNPIGGYYAQTLVEILKERFDELPSPLQITFKDVLQPSKGLWINGDQMAAIPPSIKEAAINQGWLPYGKAVISDGFPCIEADQLIDYGCYEPPRFTRSVYRIDHNNHGQVTITVDSKSNAVYQWADDGIRKVSENIKAEDKSLKPWILAAKLKSSGEMLYVDGVVPLGISQTVDANADTTAGMLLASGLQDRQRGQLPPEMRLSNSAVVQDMLEAQVPVQLMIFQDLMMSGPVFKRMQELAA